MSDFDNYLKSLQSHNIDDITEHSQRLALQSLLESITDSKVKILHEPKREGKFGSPDFKVTNTESIIGYVENKKVEENLDKTIKSDQIKKYQSLSDNILLTNYIDWIWLKGGKIQKRETLCFLTDIENKRAKLDQIKVEAVEKLIKSFLSQAPKEIADAKKLAEALAIRARLLKDFLLDELNRQGEEHQEGRLYQLYETFKSFIFHELTVDEFADAFAQNLVYGLFLAKLNADVQTVSLYNAKKFIPVSFELVRELVNFLDELDNEEYRETRWIVEEVLTIMNNLDLKAIQDSLSFTKKHKDKDGFIVNDPYVYFYENFLAAYDKKLKEKRGVYYTPPPVVNFIVRAIDDILVNTFNIKDGFADRNKVTVLDFATGTGTFLVEVLQQIFDKLPKDSGKKDLIIKEHVLKNIYGFEYLIAPYTIAHLKLSQFLKDNGYELKAKERLQVYLTNTLEPIGSQIKIPLLPALTEESKQAQHVKDQPILVITGNPPYSGNSKNPSKISWVEEVVTATGTKKIIKTKATWIGKKIKDYFFVDDKPLGEKNSKWLQDDYVKFIRFAQDKMDKVEDGIVGIITNHRFLTNPTFRGMRQSLMKTFDQIYLIDLHGSNKPKEFSPDGGKDENVFDIEQGVAISFFIKKKGLAKKVYHTDFWGTRIDKYNRSLQDGLKSIEWKDIEATAPYYLFTPQNEKLKSEYQEWVSLDQIFVKNTLAIVTGDDPVFIDFDKADLIKKVKSAYPNEKIDFDKIKVIDYRVFDKRFIYYDAKLIERPRTEIMKNLFFQNIALNSAKYGRQLGSYNYFVTQNITSKDLTSSYDSVNTFPFYIITSTTSKEINFSNDFKKNILQLYNNAENEDALAYIYAVLYSPTYRIKYSDFLRRNFPRIPFTNDEKTFEQLAVLGNELIEAHLLKKEDFDTSYGDFIGKGDNIVEKTNFVIENKIGKLYINKTQYFDNVPQAVYDFYIGGYQVLEKYLKDRKGKELTANEVENMEQTIRSLLFTIEQMAKIDTLTKNWI